VAQAPHGITFIDHPVKSIANSPESTGMGFWSINPYVGCEYGCNYCYARFAHRYVMERAHAAGQISLDTSEEVFERRIFVKRRRTVLAALQRDLVRVGSKAPHQRPYPIIIGTATDPYQPAEHRFQITRAILEWLLDTRGLSIGIITKSPLVCRDTDLFEKLGRNHRIAVYISLMSTNVRVIKLFEARSPMPHARLRALRKLREAGITVGINAAPVLPGITDSVFHIDALVAVTKDAGALFVHPSVIRLYPEVRNRFLPIVNEHFSDLVARYRSAYRGTLDAPSGYVDAVERRFRRITRKYGLGADDPLSVRQERRVEKEAQLSLL
jgi:DNA repair photolyase